MSTCLLLIDVQESFRQRSYWRADALPAYLAAQNALIAACQAHGTPIVRILHVDEPAPRTTRSPSNPATCGRWKSWPTSRRRPPSTRAATAAW